jgi:hypothetical protein
MSTTAKDGKVYSRAAERTELGHEEDFMIISSFDDLLRESLGQADKQRLLFVFAKAGVPDDATHEQRERFEAGQGGTLTPLMCVDKAPDEVASFSVLLEEAQQFGQAWDIVFVASLSGTGNSGPTSAQAQGPLQQMVESIRSGAVDRFIPFDVRGQPIRFG